MKNDNNNRANKIDKNLSKFKKSKYLIKLFIFN